MALHVGGPELKKVAAKVLTGPPEDLAAATDPVGTMWPLSQAMVKDRDYPESFPGVSTERRLRWEAANQTYWQTGWGSVEKDAPQFGSDIAAFTLSSQRDLWAKIGTDGHAMASKASLDRAKAVAAEIKGKDENNDWLIERMLTDAESPYYRSVTASDIARLLRHGGFLAKTPAEDSAEFRIEVEALKVAWGSCDSRNPEDFYRVMSPMVVTAHMEWEAEYAAQAKPRADIINAEVAAANEVRKATDAMIESLGQAWLADQILRWQKYWAGQPSDHRPKPAVFAQATKDLTTARTRAADQAKLAAIASTAAKNAADKANTAQTSAWAIADAMKTPRGRGLQFAQQSMQVAKASAAAAEAAAKATLTASNAAKATVADSKALYGLAQTQSHAINAEFRRVAAQEAAVQAKAAATAAAGQAKEAAANATKAKNAQATAEAAQETARLAAETAKTQRAKAEQEKALAAKERLNAANERVKAQAAEQRAANERETAGHARTAAAGSAQTAWVELEKAEDSERQAVQARGAAAEAERQKKATAARAASLEAAAAANAGTEAAKATRDAATAARTAANEAAAAAARAHTAAGEASSAAVNARAAATRANAAMERSRLAADRAWAAYQSSAAAAATSHAAAADAIDAAAAASVNATKAEEEAKKAQGAALKASEEASAARTESIKASAWAAVTAGHAYAAGEAASAARDSAAEAIAPANTAIAIGTPYRESDSAAVFAVLVGQAAKTLAEQQASAATAKANEAAKAAAAAKVLADKAAGDAKIAAQAAAAAAADAAAALKSMAAARASAADAARAADAAKKADVKTKEYSTQAGRDAFHADSAAKDAATEATAADIEATEAEKSAANAHTSADAATRDANAANKSATSAEGWALQADSAAAGAHEAAKDADAAADRAEEEERREQEEARKKAMATGNVGVADVQPGAPLGANEEQILMAECGQTCVDEYRFAQAAVALSVLDWVKANGADILIAMLGADNIKACFATREIESCLWALFDVASALIPVKKIGDVIEAIYTVVTRISKFFDAAEVGARSLKRLNALVEKVRKKGPSAPFCPSVAKPKSVAKSAMQTAPGAAGARVALAADDPVKPPCLTKIGTNKNWKAHWQSKKSIMEAHLSKKYPKWKEDEGAEMLDDWLEMIKSGRLKFQGVATIKKDQPPALIFQGEDLTLVLDMNGTFWSLLKGDTGFVKSLQWIARAE
ncbi:hypothetical protein [Streptomyces sp. NPDC050856]|uniref:hypothetical protein n=1 Tax=Streptomyces sp. NPDC050856 TaxID=3154939 RepID=UPI0033F29F7C